MRQSIIASKRGEFKMEIKQKGLISSEPAKTKDGNNAKIVYLDLEGNFSEHLETFLNETSSAIKSSSALAIKEVVRVSDKYYQRIQTPTGDYTLLYRDKAELKTDGCNLGNVKKYYGFTVEPNFIDYQSEIKGYLNLFTPLPHIPKDGEFPTIKKLLEHLFGEQIELILDYYKILLLDPKRLLPIIVIVSEAQSTGKSTFQKLNNLIFGQNSITVQISEFAQQFNAVYASKLLIQFDEAAVNDTFLKERLKLFSTANTIQLRRMYTEHQTIPFYGKFVLCSNRENDFAKLDSEDMRFWVRRPGKINGFDPHFEEKMAKEIPAFLYYVLTRQMAVPKPLSRQWFTREQLKTDALQAVIEESKSDCAKDLQVLASDKTAEHEGTFYASATELSELLGRKFRPAEIQKTLKQTFGLSSELKRYNYYGNSKPGRVYALHQIAEQNDKENCEDVTDVTVPF